MEFSYDQYFNAIYVIQSLDVCEPRTGHSLFVGQIEPLCKRNNVGSSYCEVSGKLGFLHSIRRIWKECETKSIFPIIHIEIHGNRDGLVLSSGEGVLWSEFIPLCKGINRASNNNLLLVMAVCDGYQAIRNSSSIKDSCPFCTFIGPNSTVTVGEILKEFPKFYELLFQSGDIDQAYQRLTSGYGIYKCERVFLDCLVRYIREQCRGKPKKRRQERLLTEVIENLDCRNASISELRTKIKELLQIENQDLEKYRRRFLMLDVPGNEDRFSASIEDAVNLAFAPCGRIEP